jgi:hypothetical protein
MLHLEREQRRIAEQGAAHPKNAVSGAVVDEFAESEGFHDFQSLA